MQPRRPDQNGFSLLEALLSMAILAAGVMSYLHATAGSMASNTDSYETQRVAMLLHDINRMFAANMSALPANASQGDVDQRSEEFRSALYTHFSATKELRGYHCTGYDAKVTAVKGDVSKIQSSVEKSWLSGPAGCLTIHLKYPPNDGAPGKWIETKIHWVGLRREDDTRQRVTTSALLLP